MKMQQKTFWAAALKLFLHLKLKMRRRKLERLSVQVPSTLKVGDTMRLAQKFSGKHLRRH
jgi:hypothetical protein